MLGTRVDGTAVRRLWREELPQPLDVLNLIHLRDERSYARYGLTVAPAMRMVGAELLWMGHHDVTLVGEPQAERLLVVRYPSHRRFLAMTMNPYYILINRLREAGVRTFEASFTYADEQPPGLGQQRRLLVVHHNRPSTLEELREQVEPQVGPLVYASHEVAPVSMLRGHRPSDPNPLSFKRVAFFATEAEAPQVDLGSLGDSAASLYLRSDPRALLAKAR